MTVSYLYKGSGQQNALDATLQDVLTVAGSPDGPLERLQPFPQHDPPIQEGRPAILLLRHSRIKPLTEVLSFQPVHVKSVGSVGE